MSFSQLENCPNCGQLFVKGTRDICPHCHRQVEEEYRAVSQFLRRRENRQANIYEVSEATGVSVQQIRIFIQQGRLSLRGLPQMGYPCQSCSRIIREGRLCKECGTDLNQQMQQVLTEEQERQEKERHQLKDVGYLQQTQSGKQKRNG